MSPCLEVNIFDVTLVRGQQHNMKALLKALYRIAQNFGGIKFWRSWSCKNIGGENFGGWQSQSPFTIRAHEISQRFWQIKLWQIGNEPPNPPKFSPAKVLCYTVYL